MATLYEDQVDKKIYKGLSFSVSKGGWVKNSDLDDDEKFDHIFKQTVSNLRIGPTHVMVPIPPRILKKYNDLLHTYDKYYGLRPKLIKSAIRVPLRGIKAKDLSPVGVYKVQLRMQSTGDNLNPRVEIISMVRVHEKGKCLVAHNHTTKCIPTLSHAVDVQCLRCFVESAEDDL